ncbi:hypothetical protein FRC10_000244 [Ceratobasidium sp. 414]|nr:hypothetical protein FRC10_000244 [Ceratobasidium sp. 414]
MFRCKWCCREFSTTYARTQHLRQARKCRRRYKQELAVIASRTQNYHVDDPEEFPSDAEGDQLEPVDEGLDEATEAVETGTGAGTSHDYLGIFRGMTLFEDYLAAVSAGRSAKSNMEAGEPIGESSYQTDIPHAVPAFTVDHPNKNAGQPIRIEPEANPQQHVTGNLANDAYFQMADFLISTGMTSNERDTFFKLELNEHLPWKNDDQFMGDINNLPPEPDMLPYMVTIGEGDDAQQVEMRCANIIEVLARLVSDPRFKQHIEYVPRKHYTDESCKVRVHGEMTSGNWFWRTQV